MESELEKLGLSYEFIDAVDGRLLTSDECNSVCSKWGVRFRHGKDLTAGELGCALSHLKFFGRIIDDNDVGFVIEDDVSIGKNAREAFEKAAEFLRAAKGPTLVQFPGLERDLRRTDGRHFVKVPIAMGAYAYGINPEAARLLSEAFTPIKMPIDKYGYLIGRCGLNFYVYPEIVLKVDMECESTIEPNRFLVVGGLRKLGYKLWRCVGVVLDRILSMKIWRVGK